MGPSELSSSFSSGSGDGLLLSDDELLELVEVDVRDLLELELELERDVGVGVSSGVIWKSKMSEKICLRPGRAG